MSLSIQQKYNRKKKATLEKRPKIGFLLSLQEYANLLNKSDVCDYTGIAFDNGVHKRSIERIDSNLPYQADNCCCVSEKVNLLKSVMEGGTNCKMSKEDLELVIKIEKTLNSKSRFELASKYNTIKTGVVDDVNNTTSDRNMAQSYIDFCSNSPDSSLPLVKFIALTNRQTCMASGKKFNDTVDEISKVFCKKDLSLPHSDKNTIVVCKALIPVLTAKLFTEKQMRKFVEVYLK